MLKIFGLKIQSHLSLLVMAAGAGCFFLANVLLKEVFTSTDYGIYSLFITFFSLTYMYGILGLEQVFLRYSNTAGKDCIQTQPYTLNLIFSTALFSTIIATVFIYFLYSDVTQYISPPLFFISTFASVVLLFLFNVFRLNEGFTAAQVLANFWKIALFLLAILFLILKDLPLVYLLNSIQILLILSALIAGIMLRRKINFQPIKTPDKETILKMATHFFIAITCFSALIFGDRFIVEYKYGIAVLGDYFYLTNLFIAPFSILQNYVGFKQLVFYKSNFEAIGYKKMNRKALYLGLLLAFFLFLIPIINRFQHFLDFNFNLYWELIIILLATGVVRLYSASINAAFEATVGLESLKTVNRLIFICTVIVFICACFFVERLEYFAASILLLWWIRSFIQNHYLLRIFEPNR